MAGAALTHSWECLTTKADCRPQWVRHRAVGCRVCFDAMAMAQGTGASYQHWRQPADVDQHMKLHAAVHSHMRTDAA